MVDIIDFGDHHFRIAGQSWFDRDREVDNFSSHAVLLEGVGSDRMCCAPPFVVKIRDRGADSLGCRYATRKFDVYRSRERYSTLTP
jgi:hypothetical protein